ncbi:hypothetical protein N7471_001902 [Penicillium samsonianum]|uniref:uncharacterized protein n=1 Tax=Penicillium samsonianum TaxID=1882272 RepID=UPI0025470E61|nr:uncharacterized protein N7471_001902 [Penicillium samsonianum]KAJ6142449.1 hypothetical protein N7471_001902 [Penicillium samsonianum]
MMMPHQTVNHCLCTRGAVSAAHAMNVVEKKKIKCDGKQPCTHCTVYSYECSYDQPSNRRHNPAPQYVEALETRLSKAQAFLRTVRSDVNLNDPQLDVHATEQILAAQKGKKCDWRCQTADCPGGFYGRDGG